MALSANTLIGKYRVLDRLGAGGMGEVYRAVDSRTNRIVALKIILSAVADPSFVTRFVNEARILATVRHPNIVSFIDYLEFEGNPCLVMEYVEGKMLAELLHTRGRFPIGEAMAIAEALGEAVAHLHGQGILHRDLKPANVLLTQSGQVKLLDFGIAKGGITPKLTATGAAIGTFEYLPPERIRGEEADARTDVWALGVILYEMVTGTSPFSSGSFVELCQKIGRASYTRPTAVEAGVPASVERVITRCLKKQPRDRYPTASEFLADLKRQRHSAQPVGDRPARSTPAALGPASSVPEPTRRLGRATVAAAVGIPAIFLALAATITPVLWRGDTSAADTNSPVRRIQIETYSPKGVQVFRKGRLIGTTPFVIDAHDGEEIDLELKKEGYVDYKPPTIKVSSDDVRGFSLEKKE
jgi:serine/threonine protein kinase